MTFQTDINASSWLREERKLPAKLRGRSVLLTFAEPIAVEFVAEFRRICLFEQQQKRGEESATSIVHWNPSMGGSRRCPGCSRTMSLVGPGEHRCDNRQCERHGQAYIVPEHRGVIAVRVFNDFIAERVVSTLDNGTTRTVERCNRVLCVLDRRYDDEVLIAVKRSAAELGERWGWRIVNGRG